MIEQKGKAMGLEELASLVVGIIGTGIAIYQWAVINESKKKLSELQYLFAGINSSALQKQVGWDNQIKLLVKSENEKDQEILRTHLRARDAFADIASLVSALERSMNSESSAIGSMLQRSIEQANLNNRLQEEALKNPNKQA